MTDRELMQQALDALDAYSWEQVQVAANALRDRLAQPEKKEEWQYVQKLNAFSYPSYGLMGGDEFVSKDSVERGMTDCEQQEPVGKFAQFTDGVWREVTDGSPGVPLYAAPRQWVGLTDEEIKEIIGPWGDTPIKGYTRKLFDQIEAKLKEKNT
jgi:hypothetical protein